MLHGWIHVRKFPLVRGNLTVGMLELLEQEQPQVMLGELWINQGQLALGEAEVRSYISQPDPRPG